VTEIPCPCGHEELYQLGENVTPLVVSRRPSGSGVVLSIRIPSEVLAALEDLAEQDQRKLSELGRQALKEYVARRTMNLVGDTAPQTGMMALPVGRLRYAQ
jgi:predicted transcriptional regulator